MSITLILVYFLSFLIIWQFVGYPLLMAIVALRIKPKNKDYTYQPFVSIIIPVYNEAANIKERIKNLFDLDYPKDKYEIIVVESGSMDDTYQIVKDIAEHNINSKPILKLIKEGERKGKASAINFGKGHAKRDIIMITDANAVFDKKVLKEIMPHFKDSKVGAVGGRCIASNPGESLASSESFYLELEYIMEKGESYFDSVCMIYGTISALRKDLVNMDMKMLSEDLDTTIQVRRAGYKNIYEPNAKFYERSSTTIHDQIIQKKRISIGTIQCFFKHWDYFLLPRNLYSLLVFPSHKMMTMLSPFILLAIPILYIFIENFSIIVIHLTSTAIVFILLLGLLMAIKSKILEAKTTTESNFSLFSALKIAYYVLLHEYIILLAWKDFILGRYSVLWKKAESTRK